MTADARGNKIILSKPYCSCTNPFSLFPGHVPISVFMKIYLLLWKDLKILSSNKVSLAFQLITPMLFCVMLLAMRISYKPISILKATDYVPLPVPHHNYTIL